jgi:tetratricopeptide (TPR) repeat protein
MGNREGARKTWEDAIDLIRRQPKRKLEDSHPYYEMIRLLHDSDEDPWGMITEGETLFPGNHLISWMKAMVLTHEGRCAEAVPIFERLVSIELADLEDCELAYTTGIFRELSYAPLAGCYYKLGMYRKSESGYALALKHDPGNREYEAKRMYLRTLTRK